jgi:hypothetical protein
MEHKTLAGWRAPSKKILAQHHAFALVSMFGVLLYDQYISQ